MSFDPEPDDFLWQSSAITRPRKPKLLESPSEPPPSRSRLSAVAPLMILLSLGALGVVVGMVAVLLIRGKMVPVTVIVDSDAIQTHTRSATVGEMLDELGIELGAYDIASPPPETDITPDLVVRVDKARPVTLTVDGETRVFWTPLTNPAHILANLGLEPGALDRILIDGTRTRVEDLAVWPVPASHITLRRAVEMKLDDGGEQTSVQTTGDTVGDALFDANIPLYLADAVSPDLQTRLEDGMEVTIHRSLPVSIIVDGKTIETRTRGETVVEALADAGVALVGLDYVIPGEDARLRPGMHIRVIRVREETILEEATLPYETVYQADAGRELDQRAVTQVGQEGVQQTRVRVRYENGSEVGREVDETVVVAPAVNQVIAYGTNVVVRTVDTPDGPREYWRVMRLYATSYHPAALGGDDVTATGRRLVKGIVAIDRTVIPLGTEVFVPGYGVGLAADTGGRRNSPMWIDLGYSDADFRQWARYVEVYILTPVPAQIDYILPE